MEDPVRASKPRLVTTGLGAVVAAAALATASAAAPEATRPTPVAAANTKSPGYAPPNVLSRELAEIVAAQGSNRLENGTPEIPYYGYDGDGPMVPPAGATQSPGHNVEATKTEPDKNTYLTLRDQRGADPHYGYGRHFVFQGHENSAPSASGYITRVNLDADGPHRVTLLATRDTSGTPLPNFDGSTWDPFAHRLLFSSEKGNKGGVWQATLDVPSSVQDISGAFGRGGYEGMQNDSDGNVWFIEDVGGKAGTASPHAKQPNSFVYRFKPTRASDLTRGRLQALQVTSLRTGRPIAFHDGQADADIKSDDTRDLHNYGHEFKTRWVTIHDTATDGSTPFDANALAKAKAATPFKRPENGQFRPSSRFTQFYFDETGDTNADTEAGAAFGGFGGVQKLTQSSPSADSGRITLFYRSDVAHTGFDNVAFFSRDRVGFVEDAGDALHTQRNALDSGFLFDVRRDYSSPHAPQPVRFLAQGRDPSATLDSGLGSTSGNGFQNDGDNEITGLHVSDGDPGTGGILGAKIPSPFQAQNAARRRRGRGHHSRDRRTSSAERWRVFYTQQHGDNVTWEIIAAPHRRR